MCAVALILGGVLWTLIAAIGGYAQAANASIARTIAASFAGIALIVVPLASVFGLLMFAR